MQQGSYKKKCYVKILAMLLSVMLAVPAWSSAVFAEPTAVAQQQGQLTFSNVSNDGGENKISLSDERDFQAVLPLDGTVTTEEAENLSVGLQWELSRDKGLQDTAKFPYQFLGGELSDWKVWGSNDPFFTDVNTTVETVDGETAIVLKLSNAYFFGSDRVDTPRGNRNVILDYVGEYNLICKDETGAILGQTTVRVNPYDSYRTNAEFVAELREAARYINGRSDMYAEIRSLGTTTDGYNMPYIIIADSKSTLNEYQNMKKIAESNPQSLIDQIQDGTLDYKIPILYSNVHADENPGADAPMDFIWALAHSDQNKNKIEYDMLTGFTTEGKAQFDKEMEERNVHWSALLQDWPTGLGFIREDNIEIAGPVALEKYYIIEKQELDVNDLLDDVFFIVVPEENADARTYNIRQNGNGFDLNRDNMFQTQQETQNMTKMIAEWNPVTFIELHGFVSGFQVEPCSPPHEPNIEYDLFAENALKGGEAFGIAAVANNNSFNSYVMPLRDYLTEDSQGKPYWAEPWDDMSTNYTPQYALLHGTVAYTIEVPKSNEDAVTALTYGLIGHGAYVAEHKDAFYLNQLQGFLRGIRNEDVDAIRDWYVDMYDTIGAEADVYRPKYTENNNFFPEYYLIPMDAASQKNLDAAYEMQEFLLRNGVKVHQLTEAVTVEGTTYQPGSIAVSMYQAKRNVANGALYNGVLITGWTDLYSEPITAFGLTRGFDYGVVTKKDAITEDQLQELKTPLKALPSFTGETDGVVVISNSSVDAVKAVNQLLKQNKSVGMITKGDYIGDYVTSYANYISLKDEFIITAIGMKETPAAQYIDQQLLYIPGFNGDFAVDNGKRYGVLNYPNYGNTNYNFDLFAYGEQMGFTLVNDPAKADVIIGNRALDEKAIAQIKGGTPYLGAGENVLETVKNDLLNNTSFTYVSTGNNQDALFNVEYVANSPITDSYVADKDMIMYGFGGAYIETAPEGAEILIRASNDEPLEGFFQKANLERFRGSIQAFTYTQEGMDIAIFANSLTSKAHQQDDYRYAANFIFSRSLGDTYAPEK